MASSSNTSTSPSHTNMMRGLALPALIAAISLTISYVGALSIGQDSGIDGVNGFVESLSGGSSSVLGDLGLLAPMGFAFAAGMASAVNPCGFAMLPAYLGLYLGEDDKAGRQVHAARSLGRAFLVGGSV